MSIKIGTFRTGRAAGKGYQEPKNQMPKITQVGSKTDSARSLERAINRTVADSSKLK